MTDACDAITIGCGLGGLTAAALYATAGHQVLVLDFEQLLAAIGLITAQRVWALR